MLKALCKFKNPFADIVLYNFQRIFGYLLYKRRISYVNHTHGKWVLLTCKKSVKEMLHYGNI